MIVSYVNALSNVHIGQGINKLSLRLSLSWNYLFVYTVLDRVFTKNSLVIYGICSRASSLKLIPSFVVYGKTYGRHGTSASHSMPTRRFLALDLITNLGFVGNIMDYLT